MVKVFVKTLQQQEFPLELEPTDTILQVKEKIEVQQKHPVSYQKLIHAGKVLEDNSTVESNNITENGFLVLMIKKPKQEPTKPASTTPASAPNVTPMSTTSSNVSASSLKTNEDVKTTTINAVEVPSTSVFSSVSSNIATAAPQVQQSQLSSSGNFSEAASTLVTGSDYENIVQNIVDMGFEREQVKLALRAAFNNPDRAVDYLMSGIPPSAMDAPQTVPSVIPTSRQSQSSQGSSSSPLSSAQFSSNPLIPPTTPLFNPQLFGQQVQGMQQQQQQTQQQQQQQQQQSSGVFDFLRQHPQFNMLRQLVQQNPQLLQPVLQQLGQQNPQILQMIQQHQQEFIQLLNEPVVTGGSGASTGAQIPIANPPVIQITLEEKAAIDRLVAFGFDRMQAMEAFFACDKDETLAANYLLEHQGEEEEEESGGGPSQ